MNDLNSVTLKGTGAFCITSIFLGLVWNAVSRLENMGLMILALCCVGLAANRSLLRLHDVGSKIPVHKVVNPYAHDGTKCNLFFICIRPSSLDEKSQELLGKSQAKAMGKCNIFRCHD